jgi:hypothetical protein
MVLGRRRRAPLSLRDSEARERDRSDDDAKDDAIELDSALRFARRA